jgi:hypothetical protein
MATLLGALLRNESGGRNIANTTQGTSSGQAQGYFQITTGTWDEFGGRKYAPDPLHATYAQQAEIASKIPLNRWDESTVRLMNATGKPIDPSRTLGENLAANGEAFTDVGPPAAPTPGATYTTKPGPLEVTGRKGEEIWATPEVRARHPQNPQVGTGGYVAPGAPGAPVAPATVVVAPTTDWQQKTNPWSGLASGLASSVAPNDSGLSDADTAQLAPPATDFTSALPPATMPAGEPGGEIGQLADLFKVGDIGQAAALNVDRMGQPLRRRQYG